MADPGQPTLGGICSVPGWPQGVLLGSEGEEALLGTVEPDAGLLEAVKVSQGKGLVSRPAEHGYWCLARDLAPSARSPLSPAPRCHRSPLCGQHSFCLPPTRSNVPARLPATLPALTCNRRDAGEELTSPAAVTLARRNQILQGVCVPGSHPGLTQAGSWGLHILPATLWAGAEPGDKSRDPAAALRFAPPWSWEVTLGCPRPPAPWPWGPEAAARMLRQGRREPLALPGPPVMWLLTAQGRNGSRLTAR